MGSAQAGPVFFEKRFAVIGSEAVKRAHGRRSAGRQCLMTTRSRRSTRSSAGYTDFCAVPLAHRFIPRIRHQKRNAHLLHSPAKKDMRPLSIALIRWSEVRISHRLPKFKGQFATTGLCLLRPLLRFANSSEADGRQNFRSGSFVSFLFLFPGRYHWLPGFAPLIQRGKHLLRIGRLLQGHRLGIIAVFDIG